MQLRKFRWSRVYESSEEELLQYFSQQHIAATRITAEQGSEVVNYAPTGFAIIWCAEGSLALQIATQNISLQPGDALRISAEHSCLLAPGISGYVCYTSN